jgi:hypothetical protein
VDHTSHRRRALVTALAVAAAFLLVPATANADLTKPPFMSDAEWWSFALQVGPEGPSVEWHSQEQSFTPPGSDYQAAGINRGARCKELSNVRTKNSPLGTHLWTVRLDVRWCFLNGRVTKLYPAVWHFCWPSSAGALVGYACQNPNGSKHRSNCYGGSPETCAFTYSWHITGTLRGYRFYSDVWCATTQVYGNGTHKRHGSCSPQAWTYRVANVRHSAPVRLAVQREAKSWKGW